MLDHFENQHSELEMSRWLKEVCLPAKEHISTIFFSVFFLTLVLWAYEWPYVIFSDRETYFFNVWSLVICIYSPKKFHNYHVNMESKALIFHDKGYSISCEKKNVAIFKDTSIQKAKIAGNIVQQMRFHSDSNPVQCDGFDVACWVCNMSLSSNSYNNYLLFGFLGPVCHAIGGHLGLFRHCLFSHGRPINFSRPCPLQGRSLPTARASHCLDPFTSVVNE